MHSFLSFYAPISDPVFRFLAEFLHVTPVHLFVLPGWAASEAHSVFAAPPEASGLRAELHPTTDLEDQDREPGLGH